MVILGEMKEKAIGLVCLLALLTLVGCGGSGGGGDDGMNNDVPVEVFTELDPGSGIPVGWTERWDTASGTYTLEDSTLFPGRKELVSTHPTDQRRLLSYDDADDIGPDVELLMLFQDPINEGSNNTDIRMFARASGAAGNESAYFFTTNNDQESFAIYKYVNGVITQLTTKAMGAPFNASDRWWARFRVEGNLLQAKLWQYGAIEPTEWQLAVSDTDVTTAGWQGIGDHWLGPHRYIDFWVTELPSTPNPNVGFNISEVVPSLTNLDAEAGDTSGWTDITGNLESTSALARTGTNSFRGATDPFSAFQRIDVVGSGVSAATLASNDVRFSFYAFQSASSIGNDEGRIGVRLLDGTLTPIGAITYSDYEDTVANPLWATRNLTLTLPDNCRFVDIILEGRESGGAAAPPVRAYFDDLEVGFGILVP